MRQATRMLGWTTNLVGLLVLVLMVPIGYSMFSMFLSGQAIGFREPEFELGESGLHLYLPVYINNSGRFPISDVIFIANVSDFKGTLVSVDRVVIPLVPEDNVSQQTLELELGVDKMLSEELSHLLLQDSELSFNISVRFTYAGLITFEVQLPNQTFHWGAPLYNLSFGKPTNPLGFNETHYSVSIPMSFESHLPMSLGTVHMEFLNARRQIFSERMTIENLPMAEYTELVIFIKRGEISRLTESGFVQLYFKISGLMHGPAEVPYG